MKTITLPKLKTLKGYDENDNEIITFDNAEIKNLEVFSDISKAVNAFGTTVAEFTNQMQLVASILATSCSICLPEAVSDAETENPNQNDDLEIFSQIEVDEHFLDFCGSNMFLD